MRESVPDRPCGSAGARNRPKARGTELTCVGDVCFVEAAVEQHRSGLLGWVRFTLGGLVVVDGVALRRTQCGRLTLSYPVRHDARGRQHSIVRPVDDAARVAIEAQVFAALHLERESAP